MVIQSDAPSRKLSARDRRARNREEMHFGILEVAREIMREQGTGALNLNEIARRVGITAPALYTYFPGKMALYDELYRVGIRRLIDAEEALRASTAPDWNRIEQWFTLRVRFAESDPDLYHLVFDVAIPGFTPSEESLAEIAELYEAASRNIAEVIEAGEMQPTLPLVQATDLLISLRLGIVASHLGKVRRMPDEARLATLVPSIVEVITIAWAPRNRPSDRIEDREKGRST
jgi:AcrR family transcriptional regulator